MRRMVGKRDRISRLIWDYGATERRYTFRDSSRPKYFWRGAGKPTARFIPTILTKNFIHDPFFQRSSCHQSISCFSNNTLESRYNHLKFHWVYDRWSPFQEIRNVAGFSSLFFFLSFRKKKKKRGRGKKRNGLDSISGFFFIARKVSNLNSTSVPTPLKFRDSGTPTYARHPGQWNRKSERKKRPGTVLTRRSFIQLDITSFVSRYSPEMLLSNEMKSTG